jgi:IPT/TIG domain
MPRLMGNLLTIRRHREGKYLGGNMRYLPILVALLAMVGCGNPVSNKGGDPRTVSVFVLPPSITQLTPATTPVNSVPFLLTVNGTNFGTGSIVFWNGMPLHTVFMTSSQLVATIAPQNLLFTGLVQVHVLSGGLTSNTVDFNITAQ